MSVADLARLLHETSERHGGFEAVAPPHDWWDWYAAYMDARERGSTRRLPRRRPGATWRRSSTWSCRADAGHDRALGDPHQPHFCLAVDIRLIIGA